MDNIKTPEQLELEKTKKEKAADWSYTTNHAIICTLTDFIDPYLNTAIQRKLGSESKLSDSWGAELIGDFGAIPITVGIQRFFPGFMSGVSSYVEPVFSKAFKSSSMRDAKEWAVRHHYTVDSKECKERADRIYNYEISHIPQALVWTASAATLNVVSQRALGSKAPVSHLAAGKIGGSILTAAITLGGRMMFPRKAEKIDKFISRNIFIPIEDKLMDQIDRKDLKEQKNGQGWMSRVSAEKAHNELSSRLMS